MVRGQNLQGFQQRSEQYEPSRDDEWSAPTEADDRRGREIGDEVLDRPVAGAQLLQFRRQRQPSNDDRGQGRHAAKADPGIGSHGPMLVQFPLGEGKGTRSCEAGRSGVRRLRLAPFLL